MIEVIKAGIEDVPVIRRLAEEIWFPTYLPILPVGQVEYMFERFYTANALQEQMANNGHFFLLAHHNGAPAGFASFSAIASNIVKLHKLYVLPSLQGKGVGAVLTDSVAIEARRMGADKVILCVNRFNYAAQSFYEKKGLRIIREEVTNIGEGYVMDDYVLELPL